MTVIEELERIIRKFFWGTKEGKSKVHLVSYEGICLPQDFDGLGIKRLREINLSLLCKWFWRLKENCLWVRLLKEKYGTEVGSFFPKKSRLPFGISTWRGLTHVLPLFTSLTHWKIGKGEKVSFWKDRWCTKYPLAQLFPNLFEVGKTKNATVADVLGSFRNGVNVGCLGSVDINHGQIAELARELNALITKKTLSDEQDELVWDRGDGKLSAVNCFKEILHLRMKYLNKGVDFLTGKRFG